MSKTVRYAGIAGVLSLILGVPITIFEILRSSNKLEGGLISSYIFVLLVSLILYIIFMYGFILVGEKYQNNLLKLSSYIWIIFTVTYYVYLFLSLIFPSLKSALAQNLALVIFGATGIPFGIGLLKLKPQFGSIATGTGVITIITSISFLSVILSILGILLTIPWYILTSIILFRATKKFANES